MVSRVEGAQREARVDRSLHGGVGLGLGLLAEKLDRRFVERSGHLIHGAQPDGRVRVREGESGQRRTEKSPEPIVGADLGQLRRRQRTCRRLAQGIEQLDRGEIFVGSLDDHHAHVILPVVQTVLTERRQNLQRSRMARFEDALSNGFLVGKARVPQLRDHPEKLLVGRLGRERRHERQDGEQQRHELLPAGPDVSHL